MKDPKKILPEIIAAIENSLQMDGPHVVLHKDIGRWILEFLEALQESEAQKHCKCCSNFDALQDYLDTEEKKHNKLHYELKLTIQAYAGQRGTEEQIQQVCPMCKEES